MGCSCGNQGDYNPFMHLCDEGGFVGWKSKVNGASYICVSKKGRLQKRSTPHSEVSPVSAIASALNVSLPYATQIRAGRCRPHPRHWQALAELVGVLSDAWRG
jgi:hypothetical protein